MLILNYIFSILQYFSLDVFNITLIFSFILSFKYWKRLNHEKIIISLFLFIIYSLLSTYFTSDTKAAFNEIYIYVVAWLFSFILGYCISNEKHSLNLYLINIFIFILLISIGFLSYFHILPEKIFGLRFSNNGILTINTIKHVPFAAKCTILLLTSIIFTCFFNTNNKLKTILFSSSIIIYIAILLSSSRLYLLISTTFVLVIMFLFFYKTKNIKIFIIPIILFIIIFSTIYFTIPTFKAKINKTNINTDISLVSRINMYKYAIELFKQNPIFGVGPAQATKKEDFNKIYIDRYNYRHLHSMYLHILANYGIVGFVLLLYILYTILYELIKNYKTTKSIFSFCMIFVWIALLLAENFDFVLQNHFTSSFCFWFTGLALSNKREKQLN